MTHKHYIMWNSWDADLCLWLFVALNNLIIYYDYDWATVFPLSLRIRLNFRQPNNYHIGFYSLISSYVLCTGDVVHAFNVSHFFCVMEFADHRKPLLWITLTFSTADMHNISHPRNTKSASPMGKANHHELTAALFFAEPLHWECLYCCPWQKWPPRHYVHRG